MGQSRPSFLRMYSLYRLKRFQGSFCFSWFTNCLRTVFNEVLWTYFWQPFDNFVSAPSGLEICVVSWLYVCTDKESTHFKSFIEMALRTCVRGENFISMMKATHFHRLIVTTPRSMSRLSQPGRDQDTERDARERSRSVTSFYFQSAIDQAAAKVSNALSQMYGVCMSRCLS